MDGKIINPTTGKWVKKDGKIGKVVIKEITKDDMLFFYSKSAKVMPGKGSESV